MTDAVLGRHNEGAVRMQRLRRPARYAGRAVCSYGAVDRSLGRLAALLGRRVDAVRHLEDAIRLNESFGCLVWRTRAERDLAEVARTL